MTDVRAAANERTGYVLLCREPAWFYRGVAFRRFEARM